MVKFSKSRKYKRVAVHVKSHGRRVYVRTKKLLTKKKKRSRRKKENGL